jgi:hypothetical protein
MSNLDERLSFQQMPEHAGWVGRGTIRSVSEACDKFWERRGEKKLTMQELRDQMFAKKKRPVKGSEE